MSDSVNPTNLSQSNPTPLEHTPPSPVQPTMVRSVRLGEMLQEARRNKGLELSDVAEVTHVRKEYLKALDEGRYKELPEDVYTRNFVRLYAQAVGLDEAKLLQLYKQERHGAEAVTAAAEVSKPSAKAAPKSVRPDRAVARPEKTVRATSSRGPRLGGAIATLVVVVVLVGAAVWGFNQFLFPAGSTSAQTQPPAESTSPRDPAAPAGTLAASQPQAALTTETSATAVPDTVFLTVISDPPGAEVSIDNYFAGTTPLLNAPVTPGAERRIMVSHDGYEPVERPFDLTFNRNLSFALQPLAEAAPAQAAPAEASTENATEEGATTSETGASATEDTVIASAGNIALTITETSWLEAYASTSRGQGQTLVYRTVQPGETFTFELPVYLHVGNAGGVRYSTGGQERGQLGSQGQVISRAITE